MKEEKVVWKGDFKGMEVTFRYPRKADARQTMDYVNALVEEEARILLRRKVSLREEKEWLEGMLRSILEGRAIMLAVEIGGKVVGMGRLTRRLGPGSATDHVSEISFGISRPYRRMGIVKKLAQLLMEQGRKEWGIKLVMSSYIEDNKASEKLHRKLGFRRVGRIPKGARYGNKYLDEIIVVKGLWNSGRYRKSGSTSGKI